MFTSTVDRQSFVNAAIRIIIFRRGFVAGNVPSLFLVQPLLRRGEKRRKYESSKPLHLSISIFIRGKDVPLIDRIRQCTTDSKFRVDGAAVTIDARVVDTKRGLAASTSISSVYGPG